MSADRKKLSSDQINKKSFPSKWNALGFFRYSYPCKTETISISQEQQPPCLPSSLLPNHFSGIGHFRYASLSLGLPAIPSFSAEEASLVPNLIRGRGGGSLFSLLFIGPILSSFFRGRERGNRMPEMRKKEFSLARRRRRTLFLISLDEEEEEELL